MTQKFYVGCKYPNPREVFKSESLPLYSTHGDRYSACIGPFRTKRGAEFMAKYRESNPHLCHVNDAERIAKKYGEKCR